MTTVESIGEFVAPYLGKRYRGDRQSILNILDLVATEIWNSGKFHNSTKWFYTGVRGDNTIITPHGYNVLLGLNLNFRPRTLRDAEFLFHQNGPGELPAFSKDYSADVYDLGEYPIYRLIETLCQPCEGKKQNCYKVGARVVSQCGQNAKTRIYGVDQDGNPIYSFVRGEKEEVCQCTEEEVAYYDSAIEGLEINLTEQVKAYDIWFSRISNIIKEPTKYPVEYFAIDKHGIAIQIARLEPFQVNSSYRTYRIPHTCIKQRCCLGLFKVTKPNNYIDDSQPFISDNKLAILSIAKGVDKKFNRDELDAGNALITDGVMALARELKEESSNTEYPIQVSQSVIPRRRKFL